MIENLIAGIFGLLLGIVGLWTGLRGLKNRARCDRWKITPGKVIERGTFQPNMPMISAPGFRYAPLVKYTYQVDGREFSNDSILPKHIQQPRHGTRKWAQRQAESFSDDVTVHYNPEDPVECYLVQTSKTTLFVVIGASCLSMFVGLMFLLSK
ncbi:MAG TPA: DUF3592 domain-containing protein [Pyrinomonadaceae bacterium]|nr:DUF3592 domain-containing protein [Pyrinomonadaceae bacterium]